MLIFVAGLVLGIKFGILAIKVPQVFRSYTIDPWALVTQNQSGPLVKQNQIQTKIQTQTAHSLGPYTTAQPLNNISQGQTVKPTPNTAKHYSLSLPNH